MGLMDNVKDKMDDMGSMDDAIKERFNMLKSKEQNGTLSDSERSEWQQLKDRMGNKGKGGE
jgi:hypothetical protein